MKNIYKILFILLAMTGSSYGQKNTYLKINHFLGDEQFAIGKNAGNNLGNQFNFSRLDYFISGIKLHHDGGEIHDLSDVYILVTKGEDVDVLLGNLHIETLDSISFYIGVDSANNHADPSLWPSSHALAPKFPEMHWGWASGYRFVAIEGKSGSNLQFDYQIHGLGDNLYKSTTIVTGGNDDNGVLIIELDADYTQGLKDININKNLRVHGSTKEAIPLLFNFNNNVFTATQSSASRKDLSIGKLVVTPNPMVNGSTIVKLNSDQMINSKIRVFDSSGKMALEINKPGLNNDLNLQMRGLYFIELIQNGKVSYRSTVINP